MAYDASADAARIGQEATAGQERPHAQGAGPGGGSMLSGGQFGKMLGGEGGLGSLLGGGGEAAAAGEGAAAAGGLAELAPLALLAL